MCDMQAKIGSSGRLLWKMSVGRKQSLRLWVAGMMMTSLLTYARPKLVREARILDGTVSGRPNGLVMGAQEAFWCDRVGSQGWSRAGQGCECRHEGDDGGGSAGLIRRARGGRGRDRRGRSTGKESDEGRRDATQGDGTSWERTRGRRRRGMQLPEGHEGWLHSALKLATTRTIAAHTASGTVAAGYGGSVALCRDEACEPGAAQGGERGGGRRRRGERSGRERRRKGRVERG